MQGVLAPHVFVVTVRRLARQSELHREGGCLLCVEHLLATETLSKLQYCGSHAGPLRLCTRIAWGAGRSQIPLSQQNHEDSQKQHQGWLICSPPLLSLRTRRGSRCLRIILQRSSSTRRYSTGGIGPDDIPISKRSPRVCASKVSFVVRWSGQPMGVHTQLSREQCKKKQQT